LPIADCRLSSRLSGSTAWQGSEKIRQVTLSSQWEKLVREKVESGRFGSPTEEGIELYRVLRGARDAASLL
jgi:hypothetical protein